MFGPGVGPQVLSSLRCLGNETFLQECSHSPWNVEDDNLDCGHHKDAAVRCKGHSYEVRLVGGDDSTSGFVEVQYLGIWGRVCNEGFNYPDAKVSATRYSRPDEIGIFASHQHPREKIPDFKGT